ncbi:hypothetical protein V6N13_071773 [Hibiscus sabdariffa]|uniref:Uncharacterized protein n=1 Tax=Hibiscus sabdariffa TaxID=183260 RepID=A0ABR2TCK0_9ROSI
MKGGAMVVAFILVTLLTSCSWPWVPFVHARIPHFSALKENLIHLSLSRRSAKEDPPKLPSPAPNPRRHQIPPKMHGFSRRRP